MKYSIPYYKKFRYLDIVDEIVFDFTKIGDKILEEIKNEDYQNTRIIVDITNYAEDAEIYHILQVCKDIHENFSVKLKQSQTHHLQKIKEFKIPYFFDEYCNTIDMIYSLIKLGVSDVYITESLGFQIKDIGLYCQEKKVKTRVIPNMAQYAVGYDEQVPAICKFFVRPEDVRYYEPYVDIFEILAPKDKLSIIYEIYKNERWDGDLKYLIRGLKESIPNASLISSFGEHRINCKQRCMLEKCKLCEHLEYFGEFFDKNNIVEDLEKNKEWKHGSKVYKATYEIINKKDT